MSIDLFTFCAQIINLIILLFLLRKFLYLPVLKAVDERQKLIEQELTKTETSQKKAEEMEQECLRKMAQIEIQKQDILAKTQNEAMELSQKLTAEATNEFEAARQQWRQRLKSEQATFELAVQALIVEHFRKFASDAMQQMADVSLNDLIAEKLQEKIRQLPAKKKKDFALAYQRKDEINIQSAKKLMPERQKELQEFLIKEFELSENTRFKYVINSDLVCGIAVQAEEQLIAWNLASYLEDFRKNMNSEVQQLISRG